MKERYFCAEMELIRFQVEDVIATSVGADHPDEGLLWGDAPITEPQPTYPTPGENEGTAWP